VLALVGALQQIIAHITELERQIADAIHRHPDGEIFLSFFRCATSVVCAATLLSEIGDCRARYPTADSLAGDAGQAPVAIESGKRKIGAFRWRCDHRLRFAFATLSDTTRHWHPWAQDPYADARARGHDHPRAIRTLGRAWCRVLWRCWQDRTPYDPARHGSLQRHITVTIPTPSGPCPDLAATSGWSAPPSPKRRPAGPSAQRLTVSRQPLTRFALTQDGLQLSAPRLALEQPVGRAVSRCAVSAVLAMSRAGSGRAPGVVFESARAYAFPSAPTTRKARCPVRPRVGDG